MRNARTGMSYICEALSTGKNNRSTDG